MDVAEAFRTVRVPAAGTHHLKGGVVRGGGGGEEVCR